MRYARNNTIPLLETGNALANRLDGPGDITAQNEWVVLDVGAVFEVSVASLLASPARMGSK